MNDEIDLYKEHNSTWKILNALLRSSLTPYLHSVYIFQVYPKLRTTDFEIKIVMKFQTSFNLLGPKKS
jgi:hypothetical protein